MKKENLIVEAIDVCSWADDAKDSASFVMAFDCWAQGHDDVGTQFLHIPYHQDFYEVLRDYCRYYEKFMIEKFEEK